jgi:succinoglycan biosynthesis protein ExoW
LSSVAFAVVIPYFQREAGILKRCLGSIAAQDYAGPIRVIVVDDESPVGAQAELDGLPLGLVERTTVLRQRNAGPGAARNRALDEIGAGETCVAFLDSDDMWQPFHLGKAVRAMAAGADLYFADWQREGEDETRFETYGLPSSGAPIDGEARPIVWCDTAAVFRHNLMGTPIGTSTVAYRPARFPGVRFRTEFRAAGEDILFWHALLQHKPKVAASAEIDVRYGRGVNVSAASSFGDARALGRLIDEARLHVVAGRDYQHDAEMRKFGERWLGDLDRHFCMNLISFALKQRRLPSEQLRDYRALRPRALSRLPQALGALVTAKLTGR